MKYIFNHLAEIQKQIAKAPACLLVLDFDGTLSPIVGRPQRAKISGSAKTVLKKLLADKKFTVAIVSGRSLEDVKRRVGITNIVYAGNHGQEWKIKQKYFRTPLPQAYVRSLQNLHRQLAALAAQYPGALLEDKGLGLALHFRLVRKNRQKEFCRQADKILRPLLSPRAAEVIKGKKVFDIRPRSDWNKGSFILHLEKSLFKKRPGPRVIYIGDDTTDEFAFKVLQKDFPVRVGKKPASRARYFVKNQAEVPRFLSRLASLK